MRRFLNRLSTAYMAYDVETPKLMALIARFGGASPSACKVLDVGCGYGRNLEVLQRLGFDALGVEVNPEIVAHNRTRGLRCVSTDEFDQSHERFDVILMSHLIEHFSPQALMTLMDDYLDRLKPGGHLVIATPLLTAYFFDDFDHVKPYLPAGLLMVFGGGSAQVQYYARNRLALKDLWFRKSAYMPRLVRSRYVRTPVRPLAQVAKHLGALLFYVSRGAIGQKDAWLGVFEKVSA